jgi:hypothetical protein
MMDAFEIDKILHAQIKNGQEFKAPALHIIKPINLNPVLVPDIPTNEVNQSQSSLLWTEMFLLGGVVALIIIVIIKIPKSMHYYSFLKRRKDQHSTYQKEFKKTFPQ